VAEQIHRIRHNSFYPQPRIATLSPDTRFLAYGDEQGAVHIYAGFSGQDISHADEVFTWVEDIAFSSDSRLLLVAGNTPSGGDTGLIGGILVYDMQKIASPWLFREWTPTALAISSDNAYVAYGRSYHNDVRVLSRKSADFVLKYAFSLPEGITLHYHGLNRIYGRAISISISPDSTFLAAAFDNFGISVWDLKKGTFSCATPLNEQYNGYTTCTAFSPDGMHLAAGVGDTICIWQLTRGAFLKPNTLNLVWKSEAKCIRSIGFSTNGEFLVACGTGIQFWCCQGMKLVRHITSIPPVNKLSIGRKNSSTYLVAVSSERTTTEGENVSFYEVAL
jgi:WD40 repeat protein